MQVSLQLDKLIRLYRVKVESHLQKLGESSRYTRSCFLGVLTLVAVGKTVRPSLLPITCVGEERVNGTT